jgi:predicted DNA-binding transcriptional regulator AlpA
VSLSPEELILRHDLRRLVPLSTTTIWRLERAGKFPRRIPITDKRVAWRRSEVEAWLAQRTIASTPPFLQRLLQEITTGEEDAAAIVQRYHDELGALPELQREQANELIQDAIRESNEL